MQQHKLIFGAILSNSGDVIWTRNGFRYYCDYCAQTDTKQKSHALCSAETHNKNANKNVKKQPTKKSLMIMYKITN